MQRQPFTFMLLLMYPLHKTGFKIAMRWVSFGSKRSAPLMTLLSCSLPRTQFPCLIFCSRYLLITLLALCSSMNAVADSDFFSFSTSPRYIIAPPRHYSPRCYFVPGRWHGRAFIPPHQECSTDMAPVYPSEWANGRWVCVHFWRNGNCAQRQWLPNDYDWNWRPRGHHWHHHSHWNE